MIKTIYFDMDGTFVDFYGVDGWLTYLECEDTYPYEIAKPLVSFRGFARVLNHLQRLGYSIGIISWASKSGDFDFYKRVREAKLEYLAKHMPSVKFDVIHILPYGVPKSSVANPENSILFDDEERNRIDWGENARSESDLIKELRILTGTMKGE